jgi:prepilin-type N-terminal cleavage/methylation domain-containing protein
MGFTLIELAVALVVVAMILGSILVPLTTQVAQRKTGDTEKTLEDVKEALLGFAVARGRLPCPASSTSNGAESPAGGGVCVNAGGIYTGFVPGATLGLAGTDAQGYVLDSWGTRIRYAVTTANASAFTTANGMRTTGMSVLTPDLWVCPTSTGIAGAPPTCGAGLPYLTNSAVAVIFSRGPNATTGGGAGADEATNANNNRAFVSHIRADRNAANGEFDDVVTWISPHTLYSRLLNAGQLP